MKPFRMTLFVPFAVAILTGCSNATLSRREAKRLLAAQFNSGESQAQVHKATILAWTGIDKQAVPGFACDKPQVPVRDDDRALVPAGIIHVKVLKPCELTELDLDPSANSYVTEKSPSGVDPKEDLVSLNVGSYQGLEVTGIVQDGPRAKIEGHLIWQANPLGKRIIAAKHAPSDFLSIDDSPDHFYQEFTVAATRYDDGWRLDKPKDQ